MLPPKLNTAQLRALQPGDSVARSYCGTVEIGKVTKHSNTEIKVQWPAEVAWYYNESGSRKGMPLEVLRVATLQIAPAESWIAQTSEQISAEFQRHDCTAAERDTLIGALFSRGTAAHALLARCRETRMSPGDTAALLVGLVLYDRLRAGDVSPSDFPDPFKVPPTVPDWAQAVACG